MYLRYVNGEMRGRIIQVIGVLILAAALTNRVSFEIRKAKPSPIEPTNLYGIPSPAKDVANLCWRQFPSILLLLLFLPFKNKLILQHPVCLDWSELTQPDLLFRE